MSFRSKTKDVPILLAREQGALLRRTGETRGAEREHMIFSMALGTALREHELVALNVGDVAAGAVTAKTAAVKSRIALTVFKGSKRQAAERPRKPIRQIVVLPRALRRKLEYFLKWKKREGESVHASSPLFVTKQAGFGAVAGDRISTRTIRHVFLVWQKRCGFEIVYGFHSLRHTSLSNAYRLKKNIMAVQKQARHADLATTQIYMHLTPDELADALEDLPC